MSPRSSESGSARARGPVALVLDLFSSVRFGIVLLVLLFVYCSIGSAGLLYPISFNLFDLDNWDIWMIREGRLFELTEFEWFHTPFFLILIALICVTLVTTTLRRIPLNVVNLGVWTIHSGLIILAIGSVWYFSTKIEGQTPIVRRQVIIEAPGSEPATLLALPGNSITIGRGDERYTLQIAEMDPDWELLTGELKGDRALSVSVRVTTPERSFIRQLLAGYPELTEDVIPGEGRAVKVTGEKLIDTDLVLSLASVEQRYVYLAQSAALYLREVGETEWIQRPIDGLPRFNDYISSYDEVWLPASMLPLGHNELEPDPLSIRVPSVDLADPLADIEFGIGSFLRYAVPQPRQQDGGRVVNPFLSGEVVDSGGSQAFELMAFDPSSNPFNPAAVRFLWIDDEDDLVALQAINPGTIQVRVPAAVSDVDADVTIDVSSIDLSQADREFTSLGETGYEFRIDQVTRIPDQAGGRGFPVAIIAIRSEAGEFTRFVTDDPGRAQDGRIDPALNERVEIDLDEAIEVVYRPEVRPPLVTFLAGPGEGDLRLISCPPGVAAATVQPISVGAASSPIPGATFAIHRYWPRSRTVTKPAVVPPEQRDLQVGMRLRMVRVDVPGRDRPIPYWVPFSDYPFENINTALRGFAYGKPAQIKLSDGREVELMFSQARMELPVPVMLDDFQVEYHVGGFSGSNSSVQNWKSVVRFGSDGKYDEPVDVAINAPGRHGNLWFFQSAWDPPDPSVGSAGLSFTVLGVGNRRGVLVQLFGCCVAVIGMLYAFYVKPAIKRRRQAALYAEHAREAVPERLRERAKAAEAVSTGAANGVGASAQEVKP